MRIGVPKEVKSDEYRVAMIPAGVDSLVQAGHSVLVQAGAGVGSGFADEDYVRAGATLAATAEEVFAAAEMIVKVKEPQPGEIKLFRPGWWCSRISTSRRARS